MIMKTRVLPEKCIGCELCTQVSPTLFEMNSEGLAQAKTEEVPSELESECQEAAESCPVEAIAVS